MTKIYKIILDTKRKGDPAYDAVFHPFKDSNKVPYYFLDPNTYEENLLPDKMCFLANFEYIGKYDFPFTDSGIFIYSKKVVEIFRGFNDFDYVEVPLVMIDDTYLDKQFDNNNNLKPDVPVNNDYVAVRFSELKSYFDFENSEYKIPRSNPNGATRIKRLVLKEPKEGFPSLFRTKQKSTMILVREDLKQALESNNIKGCLFEEVEVTSYTS